MWLYVCGISLSIIYNYLILAKKEGDHPKWNPTLYPILYNGMVIVPISSKNALHIHHWVFYISILCVSPLIYIHPVCLGFSSGLALQGLTYKDRFELVCNNPYHNTKDSQGNKQ